MDPPPPEKTAPLTWQEHWGDLAKPSPTLLGLQVLIIVPDSFCRGPLHNVLRLAGRPTTASEANAFARECLEHWCEENRSRKASASRDRRSEVSRLVPMPSRGELRTRIRADLRGTITEAAFGRIVANRFGPTPICAKLALREALLVGLEEQRKRLLGATPTPVDKAP